MDKFLKVVGVIVVAWIALSLIGWIFGFIVKAVFWIAIIAGAVLLVSWIANKAKSSSSVGSGR
ncbi:hypothetical protein GIS00_19085 [Nakamurella sp. YIM 132087]|uniref:Uncharacterized protein n=1 Tax=Nakamurella alba TaxID=2665158 RepID=A0A7K1FPG4_9ACTN|nr:hypothetical protein [Nakamurella alba]MTD16045.1 hypothetical protein [Nakamurella alba]